MANTTSDGDQGESRNSDHENALALSVVVPCYDEEACLGELYQRLSNVCSSLLPDSYEIVLVDDGSRDNTWSLIEKLVGEDDHIVGIKLSKNHGHQLALTAGLSICRGERILIIDADLQDPPEILADMMALADQGAEVVYGQRRTRSGETWFKRISATYFYRLLRRMTEVDIPLDSGDFRLMSRRALETLQSMPENFRFIRGMVTWIGYKQVPILYDRAERFAGVTKYPFRKMIRFSLDAITGFSIKPLRIASYIGAVLALLSLLMIGYSLYGWIVNDVIAGWTSVMTAVLLLGSANMLFLGVIGEYLGRLFVESKRRPLFIIEEISCSNECFREIAASQTKTAVQ